MTALRSGLAMLGRRSYGCSRPSSAASMGGRGMEIRPVPSQLRPAAVRNLESWRRFSTESGEPRDKAGNFPRLVWQWAKYHVENADSVTKARVGGVYALVVIGTPLLVMMNMIRIWRPSR